MEVIVVTGLTKSGKTHIASLLEAYAGYTRIEMSDAIRQGLPPVVSASRLVGRANELRRALGGDALARLAIEHARTQNCARIALAGIRSVADLDYVESTCDSFLIIHVHCSPDYRYRYLLDDVRSGVTSLPDFLSTEVQAAREGVDAVVRRARHVIINEPGYAVTPLQQLAGISEISASGFLTTLWPEWSAVECVETLVEGVFCYRSSGPNLADGSESRIPSVVRGRGSVLRSHFHQISEEVITVQQGGVRLTVRRAGDIGRDSTATELAAGDTVRILPGWSHKLEVLSDSAKLTLERRPRRTPILDVVDDQLDGEPLLYLMRDTLIAGLDPWQ